MLRCSCVYCLLVLILITACAPSENGSIGGTIVPDSTFQLISDAFEEGGSIPQRHSCHGEEVSPSLAWSGQPEGTAGLALTVTDPDARGFVHWVVWNIPPSDNNLTEGAVPAGAVEEMNNFRRVGWAGPCPPSGSHRYVFTLYALDTTIDLPEGAALSELEAAIDGHVLARAILTGTFP